jgi:hypothetical protein
MKRTGLVVLPLALALACTAYWATPGQEARKKGRPAAAGQGLIRSARSGAWSAPGTWEGGKVPVSGARAQVRAGHTVTYASPPIA